MATAKKTAGLKAADTQRASARAWMTKAQEGEEIEVPSGNVAKLRRPGPGMFLKSGSLPDILTADVQEVVRDKQGLPPEKLKELASDGSKIPKMLQMVDDAVLAATIEPALRANPKCVRLQPEEFSKHKAHVAIGGHIEGDEVCDGIPSDPEHIDDKHPNHHVFIPGDAISWEDRVPEFMYLEEVDLTDKIFIFQYAVGGTRDLERFRSEYGELVDGIHPGSDSPK